MIWPGGGAASLRPEGDLQRPRSPRRRMGDGADQIGRSVGYLSQVERGVSILPIPVLQQISLQLGVQITWFFHSETQQPIEELGHVVRKSNRRQLSYSGTGMHEEMLSPGLSGDLLMIQTTLEPNAESDSQPRKRSGEEALR